MCTAILRAIKSGETNSDLSYLGIVITDGFVDNNLKAILGKVSVGGYEVTRLQDNSVSFFRYAPANVLAFSMFSMQAFVLVTFYSENSRDDVREEVDMLYNKRYITSLPQSVI
uniref:VWFA domain-containing protein n=1 Tax=Caenorhabditis tropicalis TaxID=1561998 RepID=A0A1I7TWU4_9PELO